MATLFHQNARCPHIGPKEGGENRMLTGGLLPFPRTGCVLYARAILPYRISRDEKGEEIDDDGHSAHGGDLGGCGARVFATRLLRRRLRRRSNAIDRPKDMPVCYLQMALVRRGYLQRRRDHELQPSDKLEFTSRSRP